MIKKATVNQVSTPVAKKRGRIGFGKKSKQVVKEGIFAISLRSKQDGQPFGPWRWLVDFAHNPISKTTTYAIDHRWWKRKLCPLAESKAIHNILKSKDGVEVKVITVWRKVNQKLSL